MQHNCIYICNMKTLTRRFNADQLGMLASISCAIHCAALPFVLTLLPLIGLEFLANSWVEIVMIFISLILGCYSLFKSYPKHKNVLPITLLATGFAFIFSGHFLFHEIEFILIPLGGFTIAFSHFVNWKLMKKCNHSHPTNAEKA